MAQELIQLHLAASRRGKRRGSCIKQQHTWSMMSSIASVIDTACVKASHLQPGAAAPPSWYSDAGKANNMPTAAKNISMQIIQFWMASASDSSQPKRVARKVTARPCAVHTQFTGCVKVCLDAAACSALLHVQLSLPQLPTCLMHIVACNQEAIALLIAHLPKGQENHSLEHKELEHGLVRLQVARVQDEQPVSSCISLSIGENT